MFEFGFFFVSEIEGGGGIVGVKVIGVECVFLVVGFVFGVEGFFMFEVMSIDFCVY